MVVESGHAESLPVAIDKREDAGDGLPKESRSGLGSDAIRWGSASCTGDARVKTCQLIVEPGLISDWLARRELIRNCSIGLSKGLSRGFVNEHIGRGIKIDAIGKIASKAPDVAEFHQHVTGQLALNGEVYAVAATHLEVGIHSEGKILSAKCRDDR